MLNIDNLNYIRQQLNGKSLVAVTKYVGENEIRELLDAGIHDFGENRVNVFLNKYKLFENNDIRWHFIGHLQSKKAKKMIDLIDYLHSLESISLAVEIQKRRSKPLPCFLEINISGESQKYGLHEEEVMDFFHKIKDYDKINVIGLMGMATHTDDVKLIRQQFDVLLRLKKRFKEIYSRDLALSMGMSNDYQIALAMGSDYLRIGSLLFKELAIQKSSKNDK